jgi:hypothetical protein
MILSKPFKSTTINSSEGVRKELLNLLVYKPEEFVKLERD